MREFSIYSVSLINLIITIRYFVLLSRKEIKPALAMWVFFSIAVIMSLTTYMADGNYSFWDNILNSTDVILALSVTAAILIFGDKSSRFTSFDKGCLVVVGIIIIFWLVTQNHLVTNFLIQTILVIGYFPVVKRILETRTNTESFSIWFLMLAAPIISLISNKGFLANLYSWRAIFCVSLLLLLMLSVKYSWGFKLNRQKVDVNPSSPSDLNQNPA